MSTTPPRNAQKSQKSAAHLIARAPVRDNIAAAGAALAVDARLKPEGARVLDLNHLNQACRCLASAAVVLLLRWDVNGGQILQNIYLHTYPRLLASASRQARTHRVGPQRWSWLKYGIYYSSLLVRQD